LQLSGHQNATKGNGTSPVFVSFFFYFPCPLILSIFFLFLLKYLTACHSLSTALRLARVIWPIEFEIFLFVRIQPKTRISFFHVIICITRRCAFGFEFAGSIPDAVFLTALWPWGRLTSNINEYQEYFLGVKAAGA
jgi:hypothetical protein